jgi:hypothetical protein
MWNGSVGAAKRLVNGIIAEVDFDFAGFATNRDFGRQFGQESKPILVQIKNMRS